MHLDANEGKYRTCIRNGRGKPHRRMYSPTSLMHTSRQAADGKRNKDQRIGDKVASHRGEDTSDAEGRRRSSQIAALNLAVVRTGDRPGLWSASRSEAGRASRLQTRVQGPPRDPVSRAAPIAGVHREPPPRPRRALLPLSRRPRSGAAANRSMGDLCGPSSTASFGSSQTTVLAMLEGCIRLRPMQRGTARQTSMSDQVKRSAIRSEGVVEAECGSGLCEQP